MKSRMPSLDVDSQQPPIRPAIRSMAQCVMRLNWHPGRGASTSLQRSAFEKVLSLSRLTRAPDGIALRQAWGTKLWWSPPGSTAQLAPESGSKADVLKLRGSLGRASHAFVSYMPITSQRNDLRAALTRRHFHHIHLHQGAQDAFRVANFSGTAAAGWRAGRLLFRRRAAETGP